MTRTALDRQLEALRKKGRLGAMLVSDHCGYCVASVGDEETCEVVAAQMPILGQKTDKFAGTLLYSGSGYPVSMQRFVVDGYVFYSCAVGKRSAPTRAPNVVGAQRIMSAA